MSVIVAVDELWEFFIEHKEELQEKYILIASAEENGIEIYITEENGLPCFTVDLDSNCEYEATTVSRLDAEDTYKWLLSLYVFKENIDDEYGPSEEELRDEEIINAVEDMLYVMLDCNPESIGIGFEEIHDITNTIERYLQEEYGCCVYHPDPYVDDPEQIE